MTVSGIGVVSSPLHRWTIKDLETFLYENSQLLSPDTITDISYDMKLVANNVIDIFLRETESQKDAYEAEIEDLTEHKDMLSEMVECFRSKISELEQQIKELLAHKESER